MSNWRDGDSIEERYRNLNKAVEKLLPQSVEAEAGVLGSLLIDPEAIAQVADFLVAADFYREAHRIIFQAAFDLFEEGTPADLITLTDELGRRGKLEEIGGVSFVGSLANQVPTSTNVEYYAHIVERTAILRKLIHAAGQIAAIAYNEADATVALEQAEELIYKLLAGRPNPNGDTEHVGPAVSAMMNELELLQQRHASGQIMGVPTGMRDLDQMTGGLQKSDLVIVAAQAAVGKTALLLSMTNHFCIVGNQSRTAFRTLIFSLEMSKKQLIQRLVSMRAGIDLNDLRQGRFKLDDWDRIVEASEHIAAAPLYIDDTPGITLASVRSKAKRMMAQHGIDVIILDYIGLMGVSGKGENRVQDVSELSRGLKGLARELDIPVAVLSQMSRAIEGRQTKTPRLADLRDSGSLEQDADVVLFISRDDYQNPASETPNLADIIVAKHRNGPVGTVKLYFDNAHGLYRNLDLHTAADFERAERAGAGAASGTGGGQRGVARDWYSSTTNSWTHEDAEE